MIEWNGAVREEQGSDGRIVEEVRCDGWVKIEIEGAWRCFVGISSRRGATCDSGGGRVFRCAPLGVGLPRGHSGRPRMAPGVAQPAGVR